LPLAAQPAQAQQPNCVPPMHLNGGITLNFNLFGGGGMTQLGPWYQYWPYNAHFQTPPPIGPGMPGPSFLTLPPPMGPQQQQQQQQQQWTPPTPTPIPPGQPAPNGIQRSSFQPVGYFYNGQAPTYWYGR
jgi:hypothetical protein